MKTLRLASIVPDSYGPTYKGGRMTLKLMRDGTLFVWHAIDYAGRVEPTDIVAKSMEQSVRAAKLAWQGHWDFRLNKAR